MARIKLSYKLHEDLTQMPFWRALFCEALGTLIFVLLGTAVILGLGFNASADAVRIALAFGFLVMCLVWTIGPVSGCHLNPTVSVGFFFIGRISLPRALAYIGAQIIGATLGSAILFGIVPADKRGNLGATAPEPGISEGVALVVEIILTFFFMMVVCAAVDEGRRDRNKNLAAIPLTLGLCVSVCVLFGYAFSGPSLNPARSLGPAIVAGAWRSHWIYWVGPLLGGSLGSVAYHILFSSEGRDDFVPTLRPATSSANMVEMATPKQMLSRRSEVPMAAMTRSISHESAHSNVYEKKASEKRHKQPLTATRSDAVMVPASS